MVLSNLDQDQILKRLKEWEAKSFSWMAPSNIALIKYWGKYGIQLPKNPSLSFSLKNSLTMMNVEFEIREENNLQLQISLEFFFEDKREPLFEKKISQFLTSLLPQYSYLSLLHLKIRSRNTFPHSAGIASSASSMAALSLIISSINQKIIMNDSPLLSEDFFLHASQLARLGSGSASRSVYGGWSLWGKHGEIPGSSQEWAIPLDHQHEIFDHLQDAILIVSSEKKSISSTEGHALMQNHPFAEERFKQAEENLHQLLKALKTGNFTLFAEVVEREAMTLHGLMMTSSPYFILLKPQSLKLIEEIQRLRKKENIPLTFTLDAGPNIHLLYPFSVKDKVEKIIKNELSLYCENNYWIADEIGTGPRPWS